MILPPDAFAPPTPTQSFIAAHRRRTAERTGIAYAEAGDVDALMADCECTGTGLELCHHCNAVENWTGGAFEALRVRANIREARRETTEPKATGPDPLEELARSAAADPNWDGRMYSSRKGR